MSEPVNSSQDIGTIKFLKRRLYIDITLLVGRIGKGQVKVPITMLLKTEGHCP